MSTFRWRSCISSHFFPHYQCELASRCFRAPIAFFHMWGVWSCLGKELFNKIYSLRLIIFPKLLVFWLICFLNFRALLLLNATTENQNMMKWIRFLISKLFEKFHWFNRDVLDESMKTVDVNVELLSFSHFLGHQPKCPSRAKWRLCIYSHELSAKKWFFSPGKISSSARDECPKGGKREPYLKWVRWFGAAAVKKEHLF